MNKIRPCRVFDTYWKKQGPENKIWNMDFDAYGVALSKK